MEEKDFFFLFFHMGWGWCRVGCALGEDRESRLFGGWIGLHACVWVCVCVLLRWMVRVRVRVRPWLCGAEIDYGFTLAGEFHVRSARAVFRVARIYLYLWLVFLTCTYTYSAQRFASLAPQRDGKMSGWEARPSGWPGRTKRAL